MIKEPMISVIIPTYNRKEQLLHSIESVFNQTYSNMEIVVVDDGSTDGTRDEIKKIKDERVRYIYLEQNMGPSGARNIGVKEAKSEFIAFQDSDTKLHPEKLERQMKQMKDGRFGMVYHSYTLNQKIYPLPQIPKNEKEGRIYPYLLYSPMIGTPCMLIKKETFHKTGGFVSQLRCLEDWELSLRIARCTEIGFLDEVLLESNDSEQSVSKNAKAEMEALFYIMQVYYEDLERYPMAKKIHFNRIAQLQKENNLNEVYLKELQKYLTKTGQTIDDMLILYR